MLWPANSDAILESIQGAFQSGSWWNYSGRTLREFESRFAHAHGCEYGVSVCNGTVPLAVVMTAVAFAPGDKIVLPAYNYFPLPRMVTSGVVKPVFVDVCAENPTVSVDGVREALSAGVKAVVAVYLDGSVPEMDALSALCRDAGVLLIEDCAQATGASYGGRRAGSWGDAGLYSFGGVKLMTCGQGGMVTTSDRELYERCFAITNRGASPEGTMNRYGLMGENYGLSELSAVVLSPQLDVLDELAAKREAMMNELDEIVAGIDGLSPIPQFAKTRIRAQMRYGFRYDRERFRIDRDDLVVKARNEGIRLSPGFHSVVDSPRLFGHYKDAGEYPNARRAQESTLGFDHITIVTQGLDYCRDALQRLQKILIAG